MLRTTKNPAACLSGSRLNEASSVLNDDVLCSSPPGREVGRRSSQRPGCCACRRGGLDRATTTTDDYRQTALVTTSSGSCLLRPLRRPRMTMTRGGASSTRLCLLLPSITLLQYRVHRSDALRFSAFREACPTGAEKVGGGPRTECTCLSRRQQRRTRASTGGPAVEVNMHPTGQRFPHSQRGGSIQGAAGRGRRCNNKLLEKESRGDGAAEGAIADAVCVRDLGLQLRCMGCSAVVGQDRPVARGTFGDPRPRCSPTIFAYGFHSGSRHVGSASAALAAAMSAASASQSVNTPGRSAPRATR